MTFNACMALPKLVGQVNAQQLKEKMDTRGSKASSFINS